MGSSASSSSSSSSSSSGSSYSASSSGSSYSSPPKPAQPSQPKPTPVSSPPPKASPTPVSPPKASTPTPTPSSPPPKEADFKDVFAPTLLEKYAAVFEGVGVFLKGVGEMFPIIGGGIKVVGGLSTYAGEKGKRDRATLEAMKEELEIFIRDLEKTLDVLNKYDEEDKKDSQLTFEVKVALKTVYEWIAMIEDKKMPENLPADLRARTEALKSALARENLAQAVRVKQRAKVIHNLMLLDKKRPWEYYEDAKYLINKKQWIDAKTNLIHYRNYVVAGDPDVKKPEEDNHLKYLSYVQDQLNSQGEKEEPDPILSVVKQDSNQYTKLWDAWKTKYPAKK